jgi:PAS domain-containing protein
MIGSFSDLTSLMMVEAEREAKNREIVTIWESMTDAIYTLDVQWRFTHINSQAAFLLQRNAEELLGKSIWEEFPEAVGSCLSKSTAGLLPNR